MTGTCHTRFHQSDSARSIGIQLLTTSANPQAGINPPVKVTEVCYSVLILHQDDQLYAIVLGQNALISEAFMLFPTDITAQFLNAEFAVYRNGVSSQKIHHFYWDVPFCFPVKNILNLVIYQNIITNRKSLPENFNSVLFPEAMFQFVLAWFVVNIF